LISRLVGGDPWENQGGAGGGWGQGGGQYNSGGGSWSSDSFGGGYQQNYGGGPVRGNFGGSGGGGRPSPYSGLLSLLLLLCTPILIEVPMYVLPIGFRVKGICQFQAAAAVVVTAQEAVLADMVGAHDVIESHRKHFTPPGIVVSKFLLRSTLFLIHLVKLMFHPDRNGRF
jgi:hypothetical protein